MMDDISVLLRFEKLLGRTKKAILVRAEFKEFWVPMSCGRHLILNRKLGGHVEVPWWLFVKKMGREPDRDERLRDVRLYIPEEIKEVTDNEIGELKSDRS